MNTKSTKVGHTKLETKPQLPAPIGDLIKALLVAAVMAATSGCATFGTHRVDPSSDAILRAQTQISEEELIDVWIEVFDPGTLPTDKESSSGLSMDIRRAEARFMPVELRSTMENTGYWGAVRVAPRQTEGFDAVVRGTIVKSDGEELLLKISASDATGRKWLDKSYDYKVKADDYAAAMHAGGEVFQPLFNAIANDLASFRGSLNADQLINIRRMGRLRFGADLAPDTFGQFIERNDNGRYKLLRLPAENDPMYARIMKIRERDLMLVDTLSQHMENFHGNMKQSYGQWRQMRTEEATQMREIEHQANKRKLLGIGAIAAAIGAQILGGGSPAVNTASNVLVLGGIVALKSGFDKAGETDIHKAAIEELGDSFAADTRPMTVEVEGKTLKLTGSAEAQYTEWRTLLRDIYSSESGFSTADNSDGA